jgi:hypothetical protein
MSDREPEIGHSSRLLRALIWSGIGLAPIAALIVLVGGDGPERFAVLLVTVCVVLLGASLLIRNDPVLLRLHVEGRLADQIGALRDEVRGELATVAARAAATPSAGAPGRAPVGGAPGGSVPAGSASVQAAAAPGRASVGAAPVGSARVGAPSADVGSASVGSASVGPVSASGGPAPGSLDARGAIAAAAVPGRRVASAPGWPDPRPLPHAVDPGADLPADPASPYAGGSGVARARTVYQVGGAAVPGQRGHRTSGVRPPTTPVFRSPAPASAEPHGAPAGSTGEVRPGHVVKSRHQERVYGSQPAEGEQSGRRRADVTAVDIGYTGRRSKGNHAAEEDDPGYGGGPDDAELGYSGSGRSGSEYRGSSYGYRREYSNADHGEFAFGDPAPGYPGWTEAEERWRGRDRTGW